MSRLLAAALLAALFAGPGSVSAQVHESAAAAALRARVDSLVPEWRAAGLRMQQRDSVQRMERRLKDAAKLDTLASPPFVIITRQSYASSVFKLFREALRQHKNMLAGLEAAPTVTLLVGSDVAFGQMQKAPRHRVVSMIMTFHRGLRQRIADAAVDDALFEFMSDSTRAWLMDGKISTGVNYTDTFRELATTDAALTQGCLDARTESCLDALGLGAPLDSLHGHTPEQIRRLAARSAVPGNALQRGCVDRNDFQQCMRFYAPYGGPPLPLSANARAGVLRFAFQRGGRGSVARAMRGAGPADAIALAAGMPVEDLVADWRRTIDRERSVPSRGIATGSATTLLWAGVAVAFALRSTRRRVG